MAAGPLFVVVDEDVVPGERAHVEGVERAEEPHQGAARQGEHKHVQALHNAGRFLSCYFS